MSSAVSQVQATKVTLLNQRIACPRILRPIHEEPYVQFSLETIDLSEWKVYPCASNMRFSPSASNGRGWTWTRVAMHSRDAEGVAIRRRSFGQGSERIVYQLVEVRKVEFSGSVTWKICSDVLVAKEPKYEDDEIRKWSFHEKFCKTQTQAQHLAERFSHRIRDLFDSHRLPQAQMATFEFLGCSVYDVWGSTEDEPGFHRGFLVESQLDPNQFSKWNSNDGYVKGIRDNTKQRAVNLMTMLNPTQRMESIRKKVRVEDHRSDDVDEGAESDDGDEEGAEIDDEDEIFEKDSTIAAAIHLSDFPQAFSHWSYRYTKRVKLICDLQGVLVVRREDEGFVFRCTDPVIHYVSRTNRRHVHGSTDHGLRGIHAFFRTHKCNHISLSAAWFGLASSFLVLANYERHIKESTYKLHLVSNTTCVMFQFALFGEYENGLTIIDCLLCFCSYDYESNGEKLGSWCTL